MIQITINNKDYQFATTLRVLYELRKTFGCKTLQEALQKIQTLDLDNQLKLLYTAYNCCKNNKESLTLTDFTDLLLDHIGMVTLTNLINNVIEGFMYSGLTDVEREEAKKMETEAAKQAGATSSVTDIE